MGAPVDPPPVDLPHVDLVEYRRTAGLFATGVTVVTTAVDDILHGMTANAFASLSLDPLLVLVCVDRRAGLHELLVRAGAFAVTVLAEDQEATARWFASPHRPDGRDQFDGWDWVPGPSSGSPLLQGGSAYLDCRLRTVHDGGDHSIFLGSVHALGPLGGGAPLLWYDGAYRRLGGAPDPVGGPAQNVPNSRSPKSPRPGTM